MPSPPDLPSDLPSEPTPAASGPDDPVAGWRRPLLRPGLLVTRRDDRHLQVGLDPGLVLPATEPTRRLLADLVAGRVIAPTARGSPAWRRLVEHDLLVDGDGLTSRLPGDDDGARAIAAAYAVLGPAAGERLDARARRHVAVEAPPDWSGPATDLLIRSGLSPAVRRAPDAVLLMALGVADRSRTDRLVRDDVPHLLVTCGAGTVEVGPLVVPGLTACLRCVDAARAESDPRRGVVVDQQARHGTWRADGVPAPVDPAVTTAAVAWAVADLVAYLDGRTPTTWSRSVTLGPGLDQRSHGWPRHPRCGCAWLSLREAE